jgi:CMP-N,N'-diacetyllegionaminic acid synthase
LKIVALIPARGGSKGIADKNLQTIEGRSLIQICIETASRVSLISEIYISSDSEKILSIGGKLGARLVKRPDEVSDDVARAEEVVYHFLENFTDTDRQDLIIVYLQPTSPFTSTYSIEACIAKYLKNVRPVVSVKQVNEHPDKMFTINHLGNLSSYSDNPQPTKNRQDLQQLFLPSGGVYVFSAADFLNYQTIPVLNAIPYLVNGSETLDIDNRLDLEIARKIGSTGEL